MLMIPIREAGFAISQWDCMYTSFRMELREERDD